MLFVITTFVFLMINDPAGKVVDCSVHENQDESMVPGYCRKKRITYSWKKKQYESYTVDGDIYLREKP